MKEILFLTMEDSGPGFALTGVRQQTLSLEEAWPTIQQACADPDRGEGNPGPDGGLRANHSVDNRAVTFLRRVHVQVQRWRPEMPLLGLHPQVDHPLQIEVAISGSRLICTGKCTARFGAIL